MQTVINNSFSTTLEASAQKSLLQALLHISEKHLRKSVFLLVQIGMDGAAVRSKELPKMFEIARKQSMALLK